jgi:hypothetical protein
MGKAASALDEVIDHLAPDDRARGIVEVSHVAHVSGVTVYRWIKAGKVSDGLAAMALARARHPKNLAARWDLAERLLTKA